MHPQKANEQPRPQLVVQRAARRPGSFEGRHSHTPLKRGEHTCVPEDFCGVAFSPTDS
jgi:hypothetical protein